MDYLIIIKDNSDEKIYLCCYCGEQITVNAVWHDCTRGYSELKHTCVNSDIENKLSADIISARKKQGELERELGKHRKQNRKYVFKFDCVFQKTAIKTDSDDEDI